MSNKVKATIHVTQRENNVYFNQKLPTWRNGFCKIERTVHLMDDPDNVYNSGEYGYINVNGKKIIVTGSQNNMDIYGEMQN